MGWLDLFRRSAVESHHSRSRYTLRIEVSSGQDIEQCLSESKHLEKAEELLVVGDVKASDVAGLPSIRQRIADGDLRLTCRSLEEEEALHAAHEAQRHTRNVVQEIAFQAALRSAAQHSSPHPSEQHLISPPIDARDLRPEVSLGEPQGALQGRVGPRVRAQDLTLGDEPLQPELAQRVRAWPVVALINEPLVAESVETLAGALRALLQSRLGDLPFRVDTEGFGGPGKYLHVHTSIVAPPDGATPMAIEIYARILGAGRLDFSTPEGARFLVRRRQQLDEPTRIDGVDLPSPLYLCVESATYANVQFPGIGVPVYF